MMEASEFKDVLDRLAATNSRNDKKEIIREVSDEPAAISFLSGSEFDDAGLGKKTVLDCVQDVYGDEVDGTPTVSESLANTLSDDYFGESRSVDKMREDMEMLADASGNEMKQMLRTLLDGYTYPEVLTHACLDDWPTGVSDTTIANALDLRDSLPFYESIVDAAEVSGEPLTEPQVGSAFSPQLAKSESSLPEWQD